MRHEAETLTKGLGGHWAGRRGRAQCPVCEGSGESLSICEADDGRLLLTCFRNCTFRDILDVSISRGLLAGRKRDYHPPSLADLRKIREQAEAEKRGRIDYARKIWRQGQPIADTPAERYLRERGLRGPFPETLRFTPSLKHGPTGAYLPAMLAAVAVSPSRDVVGLHRTFLAGGREGWTQAPVTQSKMMIGPCTGGAVRLAQVVDHLAVCEGIETGLSVQQRFEMPTWAGLSTSGIRGLVLPDEVRRVDIYCDHDQSKKPDGTEFNPGLEAAQKAADGWLAQGKKVKIHMPTTPKTDFNDVLLGSAA
ncbi:virulence-associated protein E [Pelagibius litoralis]|uniref:Virulence-associated protein E n=1 Tax=Pelagibius litoralis TaxID=374515 RepID=A0A967CB42_9PROT|nr:toprim domain-containing protein [Pelagibius litoralis]NIA67904.1 virulence-associated protein E [Pelagibius litoralis]